MRHKIGIKPKKKHEDKMGIQVTLFLKNKKLIIELRIYQKDGWKPSFTGGN